jgi:hypothetical protein
MNLKLTAVVAGAALAVSVAFTSFVPVASAQAVPPMLGSAMRLLQELEQQLKGLSNTIAGFAESFTTKNLNFTNGDGTQMTVQTLCIGHTCLDEAQLESLLAAESQNASSADPAVATSSNTSGAATTSISESPIILINGDSPAIIQVGDTYTDPGATITGPQADLNLGITTYVNGVEMSPVQVDTTQATTDTIDYVVTDQSGLTATSTRTVIIEASPSVILTGAASTTAATTTSQ